MNELILHHYDISNFSEKVRLILGFEELSWSSVQIPATAPKPDYTPLDGRLPPYTGLANRRRHLL